jgi:hypothetical protein
MSFTWNRDYKDLEQVAQWLPEYTEVHAAAIKAEGRPYNAFFKGKIPGIAGDREDTAIYLLQGLYRQREMDARISGWLADGYRHLTELDAVTKFPAVILYRADRSGEWHLYEAARLVPEAKPNQAAVTGKISALIPKGKRTHGVLVGVNSFAVLVKS